MPRATTEEGRAPVHIDVPLTAGLDGVAAQARALADAGADGGFTLEANRDVLFPLLEAAHSGLLLYPNVAIAFPRSPMHLAYQAWDLQRATGGRFALGLGSQIRPHIERRYGARWDRPVRQMRQYVEALGAIFRAFSGQGPLEYRGDYHTLTLLTPTFVPEPLTTAPPPVWVGCLGPQMTAAAAEVADGLIVHPFSSETFLRRRTLPIVERALAGAGRSREDFTVVVDVIACVYRDEAERAQADAGCRSNLAFYGSTPSYRVTLDEHGQGGLQPELNRLSKAGRWTEMAGLIDDDLLGTICVRGTPAEVATALAERYGDIADRVALSLPYRPAPGLLEEVLGELR